MIHKTETLEITHMTSHTTGSHCILSPPKSHFYMESRLCLSPIPSYFSCFQVKDCCGFSESPVKVESSNSNSFNIFRRKKETLLFRGYKVL